MPEHQINLPQNPATPMQPSGSGPSVVLRLASIAGLTAGLVTAIVYKTGTPTIATLAIIIAALAGVEVAHQIKQILNPGK